MCSSDLSQIHQSLLPSVAGVDAEYTDPIPDYLRIGEHHPIVAKLQQRLMDLGFMDNDEPTDFYGEVTQSAVKIYQRQNKLAQDGIIGPETLEAILSPDAKYYAAQMGDVGDDIKRIQDRLYQMGYLAYGNQVTGNFGEATEAAVKKMQSVNGLERSIRRQRNNCFICSCLRQSLFHQNHWRSQGR